MCVLLAWPAVGWAEWQVKPFIGVTFGGDNTFLALDQVSGERKLALGARVTWLGNFIGVEGEVARVPGFFQTATSRRCQQQRHDGDGQPPSDAAAER